jgi:hypothetical protein
MKKIKLLALIAIILVATTPTTLSASTPINPIETTSNKTSSADDYAVLYHRLNEINDMKKTDLSRADKRILRKEVKSIEKNMQKISSGGGVYISAGAIIIILILLIILL